MTRDDSYAFTYAGVHEAPRASGLYTIYSPVRWVYVGESDDIRQSLYQLLNESPEWMERFGPLTFSFEELSRTERTAAGRAMVKELNPVRHFETVH